MADDGMSGHPEVEVIDPPLPVIVVGMWEYGWRGAGDREQDFVTSYY
jgi:hypothetical protein